MKMILFDLGQTLEDHGVLLPGALETLRATHAMHDVSGEAPILALVSNFDMPATPEEIPMIQQRYYEILDQLHIRSFFKPESKKVTLSTEVGVFKPDVRIFQAVINKFDDLRFPDVVFITENLAHVEAARKLGMTAIHFKGPGQNTGDVDQLIDLIPLIQAFLARNAQH